MIDKGQVIEAVTERLQKLPVGHYIDLRTYKRNRSVIIIKMDMDDLLVIEDGHAKEQYHIKLEKLKKLLMTLLRKEFPKSHKIRLYVMGKFVEGEAQNIKRKIL